MWVLKTHGETFYVNHVDCKLPWSTKETPDNDHTKGSLKIKECHLIIDDDNCATIVPLSLLDKFRLRNAKQNQIAMVRIIFRTHGTMHVALVNSELKHTKIKLIHGSCRTSFAITDIEETDVVFAKLKHDFRVLATNEHYYKAYDEIADGITEDEDLGDDGSED